MRFIYKSEKKKIMEKLAYYGIEKMPYLLIKFGKDKIRGYSGDMSIEEIGKLDQNIGVELMGLYLFHEYDNGIRLSLDAMHLFKEQIKKNIIELNDEQKKLWFRGEDIPINGKALEKEEKGFKILKNKENFIGCGKLAENRIVNYLPKERRIKGKQ